jgi:hypothetical protein
MMEKKPYRVREHNGNGISFKDRKYEAQPKRDWEKLISGFEKATRELHRKKWEKKKKHHTHKSAASVERTCA